MELEIVILAAGKGTRMHSNKPKVLHEIAARPMLAHVVDTARELTPKNIHIVVGHGADQVREHFQHSTDLNWVSQTEQLGTGHAVMQAMPAIDNASNVLILYGDVPLTPSSVLADLVTSLEKQSLAVLTVELDQPAAYGRIVRADDRRVLRIVEAKDATEQQLAISEINTGIMAARAEHLNVWLPALENSNSQGEYYLTDIVERAAQTEAGVAATVAQDELSVTGINSLPELARMERAYQMIQADALMTRGVSLADPARFDLRGTLTAGSDCFIDVNAVIEGTVSIGDRVTIRPNVIIRDTTIGDDVVIEANSVLQGASVGNGCVIGPYARLRPEANLNDNVRIGNFVEVKKSQLGQGSKANHLAYVGDSTVGANVNIGAGTITCNYDGVNKHQTEIGDGAFIGSNTALVAPVRVGAGAVVGAGSTLAKDAPADQLTLTRAKQMTIRGWRKPEKKPK